MKKNIKNVKGILLYVKYIKFVNDFLYVNFNDNLKGNFLVYLFD